MLKEFEPYIKLMDFLANLLGNNTEIVLHDLKNFNNSIVAVRNGYISGRSVGGPVTDLVLDVLNNPEYSNRDFICNYKGYDRNGKLLKSSTFFIRDDRGKIIGMLCVNSDVNNLVKARDALNSLIGEDVSSNGSISENLNKAVSELTLESIQKYVNKPGIEPERLSQQEKIEIIKELHEDGMFKLKGSVAQTAEALKISEPTVYRYINIVKSS